MKLLLTIISILISLCCKSTIYYISPSGNDSNSGTSITTPWKTINRANSNSYTFQPGDQILFEKSGVYRGFLLIGSSGNATNQITVSSYGSGDDPIFLGSDPAINWTLHSGNIWKTQMPRIYNIFCEGELMNLARYPNSGWLHNDLGTNNRINDSELTQSSGYWNGSTIVVRSSGWSYDTARVTSYTPGVLNFTTIGHSLLTYEWGYFIQNKFSELNSPGEWFWDSSTQTLYFWPPNGTNPNNLNIECVTNATQYASGVRTSWMKNYVTISGIDFRNYIKSGVSTSGGNWITISNCKFDHCGTPLYLYGNNQNVSNNFITRTLKTSIFVVSGPDGGNNNIIQENTIINCSLYPGQGESWGYFGIRLDGNNNIIRKNRLINIGYIGIVFGGNCLVENNFIQRACSILNDGSGIAFDTSDGGIVRKNIVLSTTGNTESCAQDYNGCDPKGKGIYFGNISNKNIVVEENTVAYCNGAGIWVDNTMVSQNNIVRNNHLFGNNLYQIGFSDYSNYNGPGATSPYIVTTYNHTIQGNILYSNDPLQKTMFHLNKWYSNVDYGTFTDNYYVNPWDTINIQINNLPLSVTTNHSLSSWSAVRGDDLNSNNSPYMPQSTIDDHTVVYNDQLSTQVIGIPSGLWSDVYGNTYTNNIQLQPFESKIIFRSASTTSYFKVKIFLDGPMNWATLTMNKNVTIPPTNPYQTPEVLDYPQSDIVDWIKMDLVSSQNQILESKSFLLRRDGQVLTNNGSENLTFNQSFDGKYLIIRHRNHLPIKSNTTISEGNLSDFTQASLNNIWGINPTKIVGARRSLWSGDVNQDGMVKYVGSGNDRDPILVLIGGSIPTEIVYGGYHSEDVNMDGMVKYTGANNDKDIILMNIGGSLPTNVTYQQLP
jgi:hypothetical protein